MEDLSGKILKTIEEKKIKPIPQWLFWAKQAALWLTVLLAAGFFSLSLSLIGMALFDLDFGLSGPVYFLLSSRLFWFWVLAAVFLAVFFSRDVRSTRYGYRYRAWFLSVSLFLVSLPIAFFFFKNQLAEKVDDSLSSLPFYHNRQMVMSQAWNRPAEGYLAGRITEVDDSAHFLLKDINGKEWSVSCVGAVWRHGLSAKDDLEIKLTGSQLGGSGFEADEIRPWFAGSGCSTCGQHGMHGQGSCSACGH
jgi:hypothetical protein